MINNSSQRMADYEDKKINQDLREEAKEVKRWVLAEVSDEDWDEGPSLPPQPPPLEAQPKSTTPQEDERVVMALQDPRDGLISGD